MMSVRECNDNTHKIAAPLERSLAARLARLLDCDSADVFEFVESQIDFISGTTAIQAQLEHDAEALNSDRNALVRARALAGQTIVQIDADGMQAEEMAAIMLQVLSEIATIK